MPGQELTIVNSTIDVSTYGTDFADSFRRMALDAGRTLAYVKRNKNDAADAEAICEAVRRPAMRFVQVKSAEQQGRLMLHRAHDLLMRQTLRLLPLARPHREEPCITARRHELVFTEHRDHQAGIDGRAEDRG
jgi:transposase